MTWALVVDLAIVAGAAALSAVLILLLRPLLQRYALARPNARSSHRVPTPQGGGIAVLAATIVVLVASTLMMPQFVAEPGRLALVFATAAGLAIVGAIDDIRPIEPMPRLLLQAIAVVVVIAALPPTLRVVPMLPWWIERALMVPALLWLVNLVNFMDGIDWITVVEFVPITGALALFGWMGALPGDAALTALALGGGLLGFAPFNRPVAKLFLGDVGSLPLGLLLGWLLLLLAAHHLAAALLLPLYYVADATLTLLRRLARGERIMEAHRSHFYQQAAHGSLTVSGVVARIFAVNILLAVLATATLEASAGLQALALIGGAGLVAGLLAAFSRAKAPAS